MGGEIKKEGFCLSNLSYEASGVFIPLRFPDFANELWSVSGT